MKVCVWRMFFYQIEVVGIKNLPGVDVTKLVRSEPLWAREQQNM